jgi:hypothetical protein
MMILGAGPFFAAIVLFYPAWRILQKAEYSGWWVLVMFVPPVNLVAVWVLAFADWPAVDGRGGNPAVGDCWADAAVVLCPAAGR